MKIKHAIEELKSLTLRRPLCRSEWELGMVTGLVTDPTWRRHVCGLGETLEKQKHDLYKYTKSTEGRVPMKS